MVFEQDVASRFVRKLGLRQSRSKDEMKKFAARTREWEGDGNNVDQAAMKAAKDMFPDFEAAGYAGVLDAMENLLADIERL